jgi:hypothetical protein
MSTGIIDDRKGGSRRLEMLLDAANLVLDLEKGRHVGSAHRAAFVNR